MTTSLGRTGPQVFPVALGCMGMSGVYGATRDDASVALIGNAIDRGITMIDTGDFYASGHNELLVGRAIAGRRDKVQLSVKFGMMRSPEGGFLGADCRPAAVKNFATYSLRRLGVEVIDVYRPARLDPEVPIEDTVGAIAELVKAGYVRHIGLSEVGVDTIRRAAKVHPIVDLQIEYSLVTRKPEDKIFPALAELGISATLYGVLSRGLLTGSKVTAGDMRGHMPRFTAANLATNERVVASIGAFAADHQRTPGELLIAWALARQPTLVPVIGARTPAQLDAMFAAALRPLTAAEVAALEALVPRDAIVGDRYAAAQMAHLDSEQ
jgi:aryl-alcohol dehydrogenase-like predicted oxidoreductase